MRRGSTRHDCALQPLQHLARLQVTYNYLTCLIWQFHISTSYGSVKTTRTGSTVYTASRTLLARRSSSTLGIVSCSGAFIAAETHGNITHTLSLARCVLPAAAVTPTLRHLPSAFARAEARVAPTERNLQSPTMGADGRGCHQARVEELQQPRAGCRHGECTSASGTLAVGLLR